MSCAKSFLLPFLVFVTLYDRTSSSVAFNDVNITLATIMIVIGTIDQHYTTHTCTCTYQCLLHCPHSIVCSHFPSSSYYHYIITVIKVSGVYQ